MTIVRFTPGPWHRNIPPAQKYPIIFASRNTHVAQVRGQNNDPETEANCNLIASAPEMYEALQNLLEIHKRDELGGPDTIATDTWRAEVWRQVEAVMLKARGESEADDAA